MLLGKYVVVLLLWQFAAADEQPHCLADNGMSTCEEQGASSDGAVLLQRSSKIVSIPQGNQTIIEAEKELTDDESYDVMMVQEDQTNIDEEPEDWSDYDDLIKGQEEEDVSQTEVDEEFDDEEEGAKFEGGESDSLERFGSEEEAREALIARTTAESEASALESFRQQMAIAVQDAVGDSGSMVVGRLETVACQAGHYIHHVFVHFNQQEATLACRPCHAECRNVCYGPSLDECIVEPDSMIQTAAHTDGAAVTTSLVSTLERSLQGLLTNMTDESYDELVKQNSTIVKDTVVPELEKCLKDATCTATSSYVGEVTGKSQDDKAVVVMTSSTSLKTGAPNGIDAYVALPKAIRKKLDKEAAASGFVPGMFEAPKTSNDDPLAPAAEDLSTGTKSSKVSFSENANAFGDDGSDGSNEGWWGRRRASRRRRRYVARRRQAVVARRRKSGIKSVFSKAAMTHTKHRMKAKVLSWAKWQSKKKAKDFAKSEIAKWLKRPKSDKCTAAMDYIIGTAQSVYGCVKEKYDTLKKVVCDPPAQFKTLKDNVDTAVGTAKVLKTVSHPFQNVPYVGPVAKQLYGTSSTFMLKAKPHQKTLEKLFSQPRRWIKEDADCCPPLATKDKKCKKDWKYKCGGCEKGAMCYANRFCNAIIKMENKVNAWKKANLDPTIDSMTDAMVMGKDAALTVNSVFAKCGIKTCTEAEKFAKGVKKMVDQKFLDKFCPIPTPKLKMPNLSMISKVIGFLLKIRGIVMKIKFYMDKKFCVSVPKIKFWTETKCTNVPLPCCSCCSRRRWVPKPRCGWCNNRVCAPVPRSKAWTERVCFSAMSIINGIMGLLKKLFSPILNTIKFAINAFLIPIKAMIGKLIDQFMWPLKQVGGFKFPDLKVMQIDLPKLPVPLDCYFVKKMIKDGR